MTNKIIQKTLQNLKTVLQQRRQKQPQTPLLIPISPREPPTKGEELCSCKKNSTNAADQKGFKGLKEEKKTITYSVVKQEESSFLAVHALAQKMNDLELMDVNDDEDQVSDLEEVFHYYSLITCPVYLEIVDRFFMDMYSEYIVPHLSKSVNSSMRELGSASRHGSMRKLGGLASAHCSRRSLGPLKL
ncbi:hypothetical protein F511_06118 [Dorcoceras hygrometricum]|uniref:Uncharacterized protein n=1 Tax=Dorcoceras hygrometricum TaxID=472368 RepID=A0A2Z7D9L7_9LAMI|nr:hypothetical protein F511_06118 [Dorcoceras hygrometricum]